jgi:hypothetical protein
MRRRIGQGNDIGTGSGGIGAANTGMEANIYSTTPISPRHVELFELLVYDENQLEVSQATAWMDRQENDHVSPGKTAERSRIATNSD